MTKYIIFTHAVTKLMYLDSCKINFSFPNIIQQTMMLLNLVELSLKCL